MDHKRVGSRRERNNRVCVHRCESDSGEKKVVKQSNRVNSKGKDVKSGFFGFSKLGFLSSDDYNQKVAKLEMVFSSVSLKASSFFLL